jgi:hypothetical protein
MWHLWHVAQSCDHPLMVRKCENTWIASYGAHHQSPSGIGRNTQSPPGPDENWPCVLNSAGEDPLPSTQRCLHIIPLCLIQIRNLIVIVSNGLTMSPVLNVMNSTLETSTLTLDPHSFLIFCRIGCMKWLRLLGWFRGDDLATIQWTLWVWFQLAIDPMNWDQSTLSSEWCDLVAHFNLNLPLVSGEWMPEDNRIMSWGY